MKKIVLILFLALCQVFNLFGIWQVKATELGNPIANGFKITLWISKPIFTINGETRSFDFPVFVENGRAFIQVRPFVESISGNVEWYTEEKKVSILFNSTKIELLINKPIAKVNELEVPLDPTNTKIVPKIINGRTVVPLRFLAESLGFMVNWNDTDKSIELDYMANLISINVGETYTISLEENASAGYTWHYKINDPSIIAVEKDYYTPPSSTKPGAPQKHNFVIKGLKPGTTQIVFMYYRSFEPNKIEKTVMYEFTVK
ncbi:MAG: stalk domain-containing protein [Caldisericum sp.]|uniref:stalk domain-containing protein n=1 Tax=Caldisericum sp. TaxID=2499687 RepID=UPI003D142ACD